MPAPAVVDAVEQVDVALYAPQLLFRLARRVNKLGLVGAEAVNEPLPVVLAVVQLHEVDDTANHYGDSFLGFSVNILIWAFVLAALYRATKSVMACAVYHAFVNAIGAVYDWNALFDSFPGDVPQTYTAPRC